MNEMFRCGDEAGLVSYAYEECEPAERRLIAAHIATCVTCADAVSSIAETRHLLAAWTPPDARLGFRITADVSATAADEPRGGLVAAFGGPRPQQWWRQPLPAWAQLAAAAVIFGAGLTVGASRGWQADASVAALRQTVSQLEGRIVETRALAEGANAVAPAASGLRPALAALEQRLADVEAQTREVSRGAIPAAMTSVQDAPVLQRMRELIAESEQRQDEKLYTQLFRTTREQRELQQVREEAVRRDTQQQLNRLSAAFQNVAFSTR
jgi:hypothetical protein